MILDQEKTDVQISGNFAKKSLVIKANAKAFDIFYNRIYTHKAKAVVRELSCNAYDSHVEAGKKEVPFNVHLPTLLEPWFSIRDFGTGISHEQMTTLYTEVFTSTRTNSNSFVGALGIGRLAPLCLGDSFTVDSFYNGIRRSYSCYKDENGEPQLAPLTEVETDEDNGVEVCLCVDGKDSEFRREAVGIYQYFETLPKINDKSVEEDVLAQKSTYKFITPTFSFTSSYGSPVAVMGGVAYDIPRSYLSGIDCTGFIKFNIGELSFDAGRESLSLDDKTIATLESRIESVKLEAVRLIREEVELETTVFKKAVKASQLKGVANRLGDYSSLDKYDLPKTTTDMQRWSRDGKRIRNYGFDKIGLSEKNRYFRPKKGFTARIREYLQVNGGYIYILTDGQIAECKIDLDLLEDLDVLPKVVRQKSVTRKISGVFNYTPSYNIKDSWSEASIDPLDLDEKVYVGIDRGSLEKGTSSSLKIVLEYLDTLGIDLELYGLNSTFRKTKAFSKGNWVEFSVFLDRVIKNKPKLLMEDYSFESDMGTLKSKISSPDLDVWEVDRGHEVASALNCFVTIEKDNSLINYRDSIYKKYPMLKLINIGYNTTISDYTAIADYIGGKIK